MAEKSEQITALLDEVLDVNVRAYRDAAIEHLTQAKGEPALTRMEASRKVALTGRPVELHNAAALRSRKISAAKHKTSAAKAAGEEVAMNDDEPWTADRLERLHANLERRLVAFGRTVEFKRLVERRADEFNRSRGFPPLEGAGASDAAERPVDDLADAGRTGRG